MNEKAKVLFDRLLEKYRESEELVIEERGLSGDFEVFEKEVADFKEKINNALKLGGNTSDGYHTFNELYHHRMVLFSIICNQNKERAWKSMKHHDGTMYDNYFIVGISTPEGDYTYHYDIRNWNYFDVKELPFAPEWDEHKPDDITRLFALLADTAER